MAADEQVEHDAEDDEDDEGPQRPDGQQAFVIRVFGVTAQGRSTALTIHGFTPHFYVKVLEKWTPGFLRSLKEFVMGHASLGVLNVRRVLKRDFVGFRNGMTDAFLRLDFRTLRGMRFMVDKFKKPIETRGLTIRAGEIKLYESNIEPALRFMHMRDLQPAGWLAVERKYLEPGDDARCDQAFVLADWTRVNALRSRHDSAPFLVSSFDIECNSSHGDFPTPTKDYSKLVQELQVVIKEREVECRNEYAGKCILSSALKTALGLAAAGEALPGVSAVHFKSRLPASRISNANLGLLVDDLYAALVRKAQNKHLDPLEALNKALPPVAGDEIIQIGVTLGLFGQDFDAGGAADAARRRHIFVLHGCEAVDGATVHICDNESELLVKFASFMATADPDVLVGYNILGFDMWYIYERARELRCDRQLLRLLSRMTDVPAAYKENNLSSSALGDNVLKFIDMPGRVIMDLMKVVQRDHKLDSYKLDAVAEHFTGQKKNDVSPADIFRLQRGSDADRAVIAAYCVQDCELVLRLAWKLDVMANNMGMANVCSVPLNYIFMRGQGIKIFSLVAKQCKLDGYLIPVATSNVDTAQKDEEDGYEGAIVLEPQSGIYMDPVSVLDYASLYPSSMISENLSHDSIVLDPKYANVPGVQYLDIAYDLYDTSSGTKVKVGERVCRFAQDVDGQKAVIPRILQHLIGQRKATRKMIEHKRVIFADGTALTGPVADGGVADVETGARFEIPPDAVVEDAYNEFQKSVMDGLQLAYKVTANSLYGALGAKTNALYLKDIAACTTATGRALILKAKAFVQKEFGARVIYGDSVAGHTPVLVRIAYSACQTTTPVYCPIDQLANVASYYKALAESAFEDKVRTRSGSASAGREPFTGLPCNFTPRYTPCHDELGREEKEAVDLTGCGVQVWSDRGWTTVHRVIRHRLAPEKRLVRVVTPTAVVDVTEDHSLLSPSGQPVSPRDATPGTELLHAALPSFFMVEESSNNDTRTHTIKPYISHAHAKVLGAFAATRTHIFANKGLLWSPSKTIATHMAELLGVDYSGYDWRVSAEADCNGIYVVRVAAGQENGLQQVFRDFRNVVCTYGLHEPIVPHVILSAPDAGVRRAFLEGFKLANPMCVVTTHMMAATLLVLLESVAPADARVEVTWEAGQFSFAMHPIVSVGFEKTRLSKAKSVVDVHDVTPMMTAGRDTFVYDLTTDNHHFAAGVGHMVVHNTDSIFCIFPNVDDATQQKLTGVEALRKSITTSTLASHAFKPHLKPPHDLEYEKTFYPFIILSKKRYVGNLYEHDVHKYKQKSMGIVLKRRDNAHVVKRIYGGIIDIILNRQDVAASVAFLKSSLADLVQGRLPMEDLVITKSLRASYKDPDRIAHQVLAKRMGDRDPGNRPQASDRIPFVYIVEPKATLQGERIEHPTYVSEKGLRIDYKFYIEHQIMKPVTQLYAIVLEQLVGYHKPADFWVQEAKKLRKALNGDMVKVNDKLAAMREREVQRLLFDPILQDLTIASKGLQKITKFFSRV